MKTECSETIDLETPDAGILNVHSDVYPLSAEGVFSFNAVDVKGGKAMEIRKYEEKPLMGLLAMAVDPDSEMSKYISPEYKVIFSDMLWRAVNVVNKKETDGQLLLGMR